MKISRSDDFNVIQVYRGRKGKFHFIILILTVIFEAFRK